MRAAASVDDRISRVAPHPARAEQVRRALSRSHVAPPGRLKELFHLRDGVIDDPSVVLVITEDHVRDGQAVLVPFRLV